MIVFDAASPNVLVTLHTVATESSIWYLAGPVWFFAHLVLLLGDLVV